MIPTPKVRALLFAFGILALQSGHAAAQAIASDSLCSYDTCSLSISPSLTSLDVVRGHDAIRAARLPFLWSRDVRATFAGNDSAMAYAARATSTRRTAAVLTDLGLVTLGAAAAVIVRDHAVHRRSAIIAAGGVTLLGASFPLQLRADGLLSRAVWLYNRRFTSHR